MHTIEKAQNMETQKAMKLTDTSNVRKMKYSQRTGR